MKANSVVCLALDSVVVACLGPEVAAEGAKARGFDFAEPAVEGGVDGEEGKR